MESALQSNALGSLWEIAGGSAEVFCELIDDFTSMAMETIATLEKALASGDAKAAEHAAHSLKGSSAMMGAALVRHASEAIEKAAAGGDLALARQGLAALREANEVTQKELALARKQPPPG